MKCYAQYQSQTQNNLEMLRSLSDVRTFPFKWLVEREMIGWYEKGHRTIQVRKGGLEGNDWQREVYK